MTDNWRKAVRYRNHAETLRVMANKTLDEDNRYLLLRATEYYEKTAQTLEHKAAYEASKNST